MNEMIRLDNMEAFMQAQQQRSAWQRGVTIYAVELLDILTETADRDPDVMSNETMLNKALLNGAADWYQYSAGGCALIYDRDIAERLCTPSELRRTDAGRRAPSGRETWLDVQARALYQAAALIIGAYRATA